MALGKTGSDRTCKLRCYTRNVGNSIDWVNYHREPILSNNEVTGTDDIMAPTHYTAEQRRNRRYTEQIQVTIPRYTARKTLAIGEHLHE